MANPLNCLNILYINIRSLRNKVSDLVDIIQTSKNILHVIVLTETWIYSNEVNYFDIPSYSAAHSCRNTRGGGACIYVRNGLEYSINDINIPFIGCNIVSVYLPEQKIYVYGLYRPPQNKFSDFIGDFDKLLDKQNKACILIGDINLNLLNNTQHTTEYVNTIQMNGFQVQNTLTIEQATRISGSTKTASILDHIITNKDLKCNIKIDDHCISDHKIIYTKVNHIVYKKGKEYVERKKLNMEQWKNMVREEINQAKNIISFSQITEIINKTKEKCTEKHTLKIKENNNWITKEYLNKIKKRDKLYIRWKKTQSIHAEENFKKLKNEINNLRKKLQKNHAEKKFAEAQGNSKKTWKVLNELCSRNKKGGQSKHKLINTYGQTIEEDMDLAHEFNIHFNTIGQNLAKNIHPKTKIFTEEEWASTIFLQPTDPIEVKEIIESLKNNTSPGCDNITKAEVQYLYEIIAKQVVDIINAVLESGKYPEELKTGKIIPIHKKGPQTDVNNYRPITLLSTFSKILEKVIKTRITKYIENTFGFDGRQYGFQKQSNTLGATVDLLEYISKELDQNKYVVAVFIDLQKAFDTVDINLLLEKTNKMGLRGNCEELIKTYSTNRKHFTTVNGQNSDTQYAKIGVAQGSVLGPLQYLLYVHSLKYANLESKYFMFADDTVLVHSSTDKTCLEQTINKDLDTYFEWLCWNRLSINTEKTVYMILKQKNKYSCKLNIKLNNKVLHEVTEYKYLGLTICNDLNFNAHVENVIGKLVPVIGAVRRCAHQLSNKAKYLVYNSIIEPHLRYLIPCWGNVSDYTLNKLQRCQNKAIKSIFSLDYYTATRNIYKQYPILKIKQIKKFEQYKLIYNIQKSTIKTSVVLNKSHDIHEHNLRSKDNLRNTYARTKKTQDSPIYRSVQAYEEIPKQITTTNFKRSCANLKKYLKDKEL